MKKKKRKALNHVKKWALAQYIRSKSAVSHFLFIFLLFISYAAQQWLEWHLFFMLNWIHEHKEGIKQANSQVNKDL